MRREPTNLTTDLHDRANRDTVFGHRACVSALSVLPAASIKHRSRVSKSMIATLRRTNTGKLSISTAGEIAIRSYRASVITRRRVLVGRTTRRSWADRGAHCARADCTSGRLSLKVSMRSFHPSLSRTRSADQKPLAKVRPLWPRRVRHHWPAEEISPPKAFSRSVW